ncbi:MAG: DUF364 domain-containing protein [bacterium]|nr:DUF364 domain-containing protein [bacterium]
MSILNEAMIKFKELISEKGLINTEISVRVAPLTASEAIGNPQRRDYPIIEGKERMIEALFSDSKGQAFTDSPSDFSGTLKEVMGLDISKNCNRAKIIAVINAVLKHLNITSQTVHCKNEEPEKCSKEMMEHILQKYGMIKVGLIGLNPSIAEALVNSFGADNVRITDLNRKNKGVFKYGVEIWDGKERTEDLVKDSDLILITGTTLVNGSLDKILDYVKEYGKEYAVYGTTIAGVSSLMNLNRLCFYGSDE